MYHLNVRPQSRVKKQFYFQLIKNLILIIFVYSSFSIIIVYSVIYLIKFYINHIRTVIHYINIYIYIMSWTNAYFYFGEFSYNL